MKRFTTSGFVAFGLLLGVSGAVHAQGNLVMNGDFELTTPITGTTYPSLSNGNGQMGYNVTANNWTTTGYNFLFNPGTADTTDAPGQYNTLKLWGPGDGSANNLPATSPLGGIYVAADGAYGVQPITQPINNLVIGQMYGVRFFWGAAQQSGYTGGTTDQWTVMLGSSSQSTSVISIPSEGFSGWQFATFNYVATATSEVLSFLATGTPTGVPPFALLDGVSLTAAPEPSGIVSMVAAGIGVGVFALRRRARRVKSIA